MLSILNIQVSIEKLRILVRFMEMLPYYMFLIKDILSFTNLRINL